VDYLHAVVGSPWGDPSHIQPQYYEPAQWADLAGQLRQAVRLPVVYTGRVNSIEVAERVLADGHADVVGMARAYIAEPRILTKARAGQPACLARDRRPDVHLLGDAFAPRRLVAATRQAYALAKLLQQ
jgi:2,4-dienoyl-CoA reductase-like NADH-dependent reductase (Old Yellow Enzyme family)